MAATPVVEIEDKEKTKSVISTWARISKIGIMVILAVIATLYVAISPVVARSFYYKCLFMARPFPAGYYDRTEVAGVKAEDVYFNVGSERLHGWFFKKPGAKRVVLMHHGNGGNVSILQWYADIFLRSDASIFFYDYEGYGKSTGSSSIEAVCRDSEAAYNYLVEEMKYKPEEIINFGLSLGTGLATQVAAKHPSAGLVLIAPYTSLWKTSRRVFPWLQAYPDVLFPEHDIDLLSSIPEVKAPVLCFHGKYDQMMPPTESELLKRQAGSKFNLVMLNTGHGNLGLEHDTILKQVKAYMKELN